MSKTNLSDCNKKIIGILARHTGQKSKPFGRQTNLLQEFFNLTRNLPCSLLLFHPNDIMTQSRPKALYYDGKNWVSKTAEMPVVLYDRFYSSMTEIDPAVLKSKKTLRDQFQMKYLNPIEMAVTATDKFEFCKFAKKHGIRSPKTTRIGNSPDLLWTYIEKGKNLILKPVLGRMGKGITRIHNKGQLRLLINGTSCLRIDGKWHLWGMIVQYCRENNIAPEKLIFQEEIELPLKSKRFFDVRILVQRLNGDSKPIISGEVARVGGTDAHVPNIDHGGLAVALDDWLQTLFSERYNQILETLRSTAMSVYEKVEIEFGLTGELGIDLIIDKYEEVHVIEINSKPGRIAFERLASGFGLSESRRKSFARCRKNSIINPIKYAVWLAQNT